MEQIRSKLIDIYGILCLSIFLKYVKKLNFH
jgi:hypothetical protein